MTATDAPAPPAELVPVAVPDARGHAATVEVSPEVAAVLASKEPKLKEITFTDLNGRRRLGERPRPVGFLNYLYEPANRARLARVLKPGRWEGPRHRYTLFLGAGLPMLSRDNPRWGRRAWPARLPCGCCALCLGRPLPREHYCLGCDAAGTDEHEPPRPGVVRIYWPEARAWFPAWKGEGRRSPREPRPLKGGRG